MTYSQELYAAVALQVKQRMARPGCHFLMLTASTECGFAPGTNATLLGEKAIYWRIAEETEDGPDLEDHLDRDEDVVMEASHRTIKRLGKLCDQGLADAIRNGLDDLVDDDGNPLCPGLMRARINTLMRVDLDLPDVDAEDILDLIQDPCTARLSGHVGEWSDEDLLVMIQAA